MFPFSWMLAHPCLIGECLSTHLLLSIWMVISKSNVPSFLTQMMVTTSPLTSLLQISTFLLPSTVPNPFSTWQPEWSWESINHIVLLHVYLYLGKKTMKNSLLSISYKAHHDGTPLCHVLLRQCALCPASSSHTVISSDLWTIQEFISSGTFQMSNFNNSCHCCDPGAWYTTWWLLACICSTTKVTTRMLFFLYHQYVSLLSLLLPFW